VESVLFGLALTGSLILTEPNTSGRQAATYAARATYYQGGYDKMLEPIAKELERKYLSDELRRLGVGVSFIYRLAVDNRIECSWSF